MKLFDFLKPPMFPKPEDIYLPLPEFYAVNDAGSKTEIDKAITGLNLRARDFSASRSFTKDYLDLIGQAETQVRQTQWIEARKTIWEATFLLNRALESQAAGKFRKWMGVYYVGWVLLLLGIGSWMKFLETTGHPDFFFGVAYWRYALMGVLGGMTVAIWGLSVHSVSLDFDRAFTVWYWLKPLLGGVMGMIVVMTAQAGLLAVQGQGALPSSASGRMILYIMAFLAGFSERFFVGIIDRVMTALLNSGQSVSTPKAAPAKASAKAPTPNR